jgi:hypothetical protein
MKGKSDLGIGFTALVAALIIGSITDTVFLRETPASPENAAAAEPQSTTSSKAPRGNYPAPIQKLIGWCNSVDGKYDYAWGGGHVQIGQASPGGLNGSGGRTVTGYDCSGTVSGALHAGGLLNTPLVSGDLMRWGVAGPGKYLTVYANPDHTFMYVGEKGHGEWFGTGSLGKGGGGPEWGNHDQTVAYAARHWPGL